MALNPYESPTTVSRAEEARPRSRIPDALLFLAFTCIITHITCVDLATRVGWYDQMEDSDFWYAVTNFVGIWSFRIGLPALIGGVFMGGFWHKLGGMCLAPFYALVIRRIVLWYLNTWQ
jgi:hypothetical protein